MRVEPLKRLRGTTARSDEAGTGGGLTRPLRGEVGREGSSPEVRSRGSFVMRL